MGSWSLPEIASAVIFGAWLLLSLAGQIWPRDSALRRGSVNWLVPDWRFFAPEPAVDDRIVVYRFKSAVEDVGPLQLVDLPRTSGLRWLWNPGSRRHKALFDLTDGMLRLAERLNRRDPQPEFADALMVTEPYLMLLNLVSARLGPSGPGLVQFGVISRAWPDREELIFLSRWHMVEK